MPRSIHDLSEPDVAYVAGIIDGEGCLIFGRTRTSYYPRVMITNTNLDLLNWLQENLGGRIFKAAKRKDGWKPSYDWRCAWKPATELIERVYPYLKIKDGQARVFFAWDAIRPKKGRLPEAEAKNMADASDLLRRQLKWLNFRGTGRPEISPVLEVIRQEEGLEDAIAARAICQN